MRFVLLTILGLNIAVAIAKLALGLVIGSLAMSADGVHSFLDGASNVVALIGLAVAARPPDQDHPYGHQRFETLTSLAIAGFMLLALFGILSGAWNRFQGGGSPEISALAFAVMGVTIAVNVMVVLWERREARKLASSLLLADAKHTLSDLLVSFSVVTSLILVALGVTQADLIISLLIAGLIAWGAWTIVRDASLTLTDTVAEKPQHIEQAALSVSGVRGVHAVRSRGGDGRIWVDLHIQVDPEMKVDEAHDIASAVAARVGAESDRPADVTVHVEPATSHHLRHERGYDPDRDVA
jgi:cation diffusion facilitator family transporter